MARTEFLTRIGCNSPGFTCLIVLRGNSASGKSTVAAEIRARYGGRGIAIVAQDNLRRIILRERDIPGGANVGLIEQVALYALEAGYHTIVEGILYSAHYGPMLQRIRDSHAGPSRFYYFEVPFEETLRRHATKPQAAEYGRAEMSEWYRDLTAAVAMAGISGDADDAAAHFQRRLAAVMARAELA